MSNLQSGTFNTIAQVEKTVGGGSNVWARVDRVLHFGRTIDVSGLPAGTVIPAGSMVAFTDDEQATIVKASDSDSLASVNGLTLNDVCIPDGCKFASIAIVTSGKVYADAAGVDGVPASVASQIPNIELIRVRS